MRIYLTADRTLSRAMFRVEQALVRNLPNGCRVTNNPAKADLEVLHVIGYPETVDAVERAQAAGRRYALIQYCLRTTQQESTAAWLPLWAGAELVWSYYDLPALCAEDGVAAGCRFYHAPLGVDGRVFRPVTRRKSFVVGTSGYVAATECVNECAAVVRLIPGGKQYHLGPDLGVGALSELDITDEQVAARWGECRYVAGLRRIEGFELPALEALACGTRPVVFDRPHYRQWFGEHAAYVPERLPVDLVEPLYGVLSQEPGPVTEDERQYVLERFDWQRIASGFWERALSGEVRAA